jgi:uncharacterized protein YkwD
MIKKLLPVLGIAAALAVTSFAQTRIQAPQARKLAEATSIEDLFRPRMAAVKSSVIVNTVEVEKIAFNMINEKRIQNGLAPLTWSNGLANVAREHSQNMAEFQFFEHRGLDNKLVSDRADKHSVPKWRSIGENIAYNRGFSDPIAKTVQLWLDSPSHRRNMLSSDWKESAIGVAIAEDGAYYFTQVFLVRK